MRWFNYQHLYYFYVTAREGSVTRACEVLHLAQPTVSGQIKKLERSLGERLFAKAGRNLVLTDVGRTVYRYAEEIFALGDEMLRLLEGQVPGRPVRFTVGVVDALPKLIAHHLLEPALALEAPVHMICREGKLDRLLAELAVHGLDLVLADTPAPPQTRVRVYNHLLGECGVTVFATPELAAPYRRGFPASLDGAPFLLPADGTALRPALERWLEARRLRPRPVAEIEDGALVKAFGQAGSGLFAAPSAIEEEVCRQYRVEVVGRLPQVKERFYAISAQRRLEHPAVVAISQQARAHLFAAGP